MSKHSLYLNSHQRNMAFQAAQSEDGVVECPILMEEITEPGEDSISHMQLGENKKLVSMKYFKLAAMVEHLKKSNRDPFTNQPFVSAMAARVQIAVNAQAAKEQGITLTLEEIPSLFREYIATPLFKATNPKYPLLRQKLHIGDAGVLSSWGEIGNMELREKATETLQTKNKGAWLIRPCSVESTSVFKCMALSRVIRPGNIEHIMIAHCYGFGYMVVDCARGQAMPDLVDGVSNNRPLPVHTRVYGSFLDLLDALSASAEGFHIQDMVINQCL